MSMARIPIRQQILLFGRLALYLEAGISLIQCISSLESLAKNTRTKIFLTTCKETIQRGRPLSVALTQSRYTFDPFILGLLGAGEASGSVPAVLGHITHLLEQRQNLKQKLLSIGIYPSIVLCCTLSLSLFLLLYVFPKILPILSGFHTPLPWPTRLLLWAESFITHDWIVLLCGGFMVGLSISIASRYRYIQRFAEILLTHIPFIKNIFTLYNSSQIFLILAIAYEAGLPLLSSLEITESAINSVLYQQALHTVQDHIRHGERLAYAFELQKLLFPAITIDLISAGEATGTLRQSLTSLSTVCKRDTDLFLQNCTTLIEPVLMVSVGIVVGTIALAIIMPIYQITGSLSA